MASFDVFETAIGRLLIEAEDEKINSITFTKEAFHQTKPEPVIEECKKQLTAYFEKRLQKFDLPLHLDGTLFQKKVWKEISKIPYGKTLFYKDIAIKLKSKNGARAVGNAAGKNPIPIIIPCHRVIGKGQNIYSYSAGSEKKMFLLKLEWQ